MRSLIWTRGRAPVCAALALAAVFGAGCQSLTKPSGFLSTYANLVKVNDCMWRYVDTNRLATYDTFYISSVKVLVTEYEATPISPGQRQQAANRFREAIVNALAGHCQLVDKPLTNTAELRAAITTAFPVGDFLTFGLEAELVDAYSGQQIAAVRQYQAGNPLATGWTPDVDTSTGVWWDRLNATFFMKQCADEFRNTIEASRPAR